MASRADAARTAPANALDLAVARLMEAAGVNSSDSGDRGDGATSGSNGSSDETSAASDDPLDTPPKSKKRKPVTYYQRKSEIETLHEQVKTLQKELARRQAVPTIENGALGDADLLRALYARELEKNALLLAGTQSLLSSYYTAFSPTAPVPLKTPIHLPADPTRRDRVLSSMRDAKLRAAMRFMAERTRFLNLQLGQRQGEAFDLPNGDVVSWGFDVTPFAAGYSLRQVYNELQYFIGSEEISISESLDVLTIREGDEPTQRQYGESRLVSTFKDGLEVESNMAMFMCCEDASGNDHAPYALSIAEFIDHDELYPYRPDLYGRRDVVGVCLLTEVPTPSGSIVAMVRWSHVHLHVPAVARVSETSPSDSGTAVVRDTVAALCTFMPRVLAERLALRTPESTT